MRRSVWFDCPELLEIRKSQAGTKYRDEDGGLRPETRVLIASIFRISDSCEMCKDPSDARVCPVFEAMLKPDVQRRDVG